MNPAFLLKLHILTGLWFDNEGGGGQVKFSWCNDEHEAEAMATMMSMERDDLIKVTRVDRSLGIVYGSLTDLGRNYLQTMMAMATIARVVS